MSKRALSALVATLFLLSGCYRTHYRNFTPELPAQAGEVRQGGSWQHFFIYGLLPDRVTIPAGTKCHGAEHIQEIETRQTFVQGLIALLASFYINIYSPWTGLVVCDGTVPPSPGS